MARITKKERKENTYIKALELFKKHETFILVDLNNVTALQLQRMKQTWRGTTDILLGKNTVIKKALEELAKTDEKYNKISEIIKENIAFVFTTQNPKEIKEIMVENKRNTYASVGMIAQDDIWIKKHITGMGPERTKYFQALNIFTQITKGKIEIRNDCLALKKGEKVGPSQANLLTLLDIKPFTFYMQILSFYEGGIYYEPWILDIDDKQVEESFRDAIASMTALALGAGITTETTVPYEIINSYKDLIGVSIASGIETELSKSFK